MAGALLLYMRALPARSPKVSRIALRHIAGLNRAPLLLAAALAVGCLAAVHAPAAADETRASPSAPPWYAELFGGLAREPYALDDISRWVDTGRAECDAKAMVRHRSRALRYTVTAHPAFVERLQRFEQLLAELATDHYGRAPRRLEHRGVFACRTLRTRRHRISEHALGNALDFQGLDFGPLPRRAAAPADLPRQLRAPFHVRVLAHWSPARERDAHHARFLHRLADELARRPDIFRGIVGPPRPRHRDHLHLDAAPFRYAWFEYDEI
jgi:hypothetical protein